jgi:hypothetical protein
LTCSRCREPDLSFLETFNSLRNIVGGVEMVRNYYLGVMEQMFPEILDLFTNPQRWFGELSPWMAENANLLERQSIVLDVVEAPRHFAAAYVRLPRHGCGCLDHLVVVNVAFLAIAKHVLAHSLGLGLSTSDLKQLLEEMRLDPTRLRRGPHPPPLDNHMPLLVSGFAWLVCHELAHASGGRLPVPPDLDAPSWCRDTAISEVNADMTSLKALLHRIDATPWAGDARMRKEFLFGGIQLVLRTLGVFGSLREGRAIKLSDEATFSDDGSLMPGARWNFVKQHADVLARLGLLSNTTRLDEVLANWDQSVTQIISDGRRA